MKQDSKGLYFLAILPPAEISAEVTLIKRHFAQEYQSSHALKSPPHITLQMPFRHPVELENELKSKLQKFAEEQKAFEIQLKGFASFPPRVIYIHVEECDPLSGLFCRLQDYLAGYIDTGKRVVAEHAFLPHITVAARDLRKAMFHKAWETYEHREFKAAFTASELTLLKHNGKHWDVYASLALSAGG